MFFSQYNRITKNKLHSDQDHSCIYLLIWASLPKKDLSLFIKNLCVGREGCSRNVNTLNLERKQTYNKGIMFRAIWLLNRDFIFPGILFKYYLCQELNSYQGPIRQNKCQ